MKTTINLLLVGIVAAFCSIANAQLIYSNNFALGDAVNISNTPPTVANSFAGGTNNATWNDVLGINNTGALLANGIQTTTLGDSWLLPFTPESGHIYLLTATVTFTNNPGNWIGLGFAENDSLNVPNGYGRFSDSGNGGPAGIDWMIVSEGSGNVQAFAGPKAAGQLLSQNDFFAPGPGTHTMKVLLNTVGSLWSISFYVDNIQAGSVATYTANPTISGVGITQNALTAPSAVQWNNLTFSVAQQPFITQEPTASQTLSAGDIYSNSVAVTADASGGTLSYQWYADGLPLTNGVNNVSGANTNLLVISPITTANQLTNYYVVVTNNYGSVTSSLASLIVLTNPVVTAPTSPSNSITLFAGTDGYVGSSPTFSVTAVGAPPLTYRWLTNGVAVGGATGNSLAFTNCQSSSPVSYACIVSNSFGQVTNTWQATYVATPTAAYPQTVLGDQPLDFWRLNESDDGNGNEGAICHDYQSGANGVYTNVTLGQTGYNALEPTETSMFVTAGGAQPSCVSRIDNVDLAATMTNGVNAQFTVEAWANCISGNGASGGAPVVSQGYTSNSSSFFLGVDTNSSTKHYEFYVRTADGAFYSADDTTIQANDLNWHYLVGVCDEASGNISLYIDGSLAATTSIPANSGLFESDMPVAIGAGIRSGASDYDVPFTGNIDDVAIYGHALSAAQVVTHYAAAGNSVSLSFVPPVPPTNLVYMANQTLTIPATISGSGPMGYYWTNVTVGGVLDSGQTSSSGGLDATLNIPNASAGLSGDQLELVATNSTGSTNLFVTLFSPAPPITLSYNNPILYSNYFNGGTWSIAGMPLTAANSLVGGTNTTWTDVLGTNDTGSMQANGVSATTLPDSWILPFTPHAGYVYTVTASLTFSGSLNTWVGLGFAQNYVTDATNGYGRFSDAGTTPPKEGPNGYNWMILTEGSGNVQCFTGPHGTGQVFNQNGFFTAGAGTHTVKIVLDTTGPLWSYAYYVDGILATTNTYTANPPIGAVGITENALTTPGNLQWNYFALSQVAPGGVPPYTLESLPASVTLQPDASLSLPVTAFGSATFGYYWSNTNTAAVLGSGTTNNMAPLSADLTVPDVPSSWNGNTLALVVTNAYGTNISFVSLNVANAVNTNPTNIVFSVAGGQMTLSWPMDHTGWTLQAQTNALSAGLSTNWVDVPDSVSTNQMVVPIDPANGSVFYRLILK